MGKKGAKKYYAIKEGRRNNLIVENWKECSELTQGYKSVFKSFATKDEAENYLRGDTIKSSEEKSMLPSNLNNSKRTKKANYKVSAELDKETYIKFVDKCKTFEYEEGKIIKLLIREWVD